MIAYFVHDRNKDTDLFVLPDTQCRVPVTPERFEAFIAPRPDFSQWRGEACADLPPEQFGTIVATRDDKGDICVVEAALWRQRMNRHLG